MLMAQVMTCIDHALMKRLDIRELLDCAWLDQKDQAKGVTSLIAFWNSRARWVTSEILLVGTGLNGVRMDDDSDFVPYAELNLWHGNNVGQIGQMGGMASQQCTPYHQPSSSTTLTILPQPPLPLRPKLYPTCLPLWLGGHPIHF